MTQLPPPPLPPGGAIGGGVPAEATAEQLAHLAGQRPDLWAQISAHPNCYDGLRSWIAAQGGAAASTGPGVMPFAVAPDQGHRPKSKMKAWLAGGVAAALAISGCGVALALTETWPFGEVGPLGSGGRSSANSASSVVQEDQAPTFADGIEERWTVTGSDFGSGAVMTGHLPRMMPDVVQRHRFDQPLLLDGSVLFSYRTEATGAGTGWAAVDPESGQTQWSVSTESERGACASNRDLTESVCTMLATPGPGNLVKLDGDGFEVIHEFGASGESSNRLWFEKDDIAVVDREGYRLASSAGEILNDSAVSKPRGKPIFDLDFVGFEAESCGWLIVEGVTSYFGSPCNADSKEIVFEGSQFEWAVVNSADPVILVNERNSVTAIDAETREVLWSKPGTLPGWYQDPQIVKREAGDGVLIVGSENQSAVIADLESGDEVTIAASVDHHHIAVSGEYVLVFSGDSDGSLSAVEVFDGQSGKPVFSGSFPKIEHVVEVVGGPNGVLMAHNFCEDCSVAEGSHGIESYSFMGPAKSGKSDSVQKVSSIAIPDSISIECPADTILLAWAEFADGWVVVCGVSMTEPTFMAYQASGASQIAYSVGATRPTSAEAKAAVNWDEGLSRYTAELRSGDHVTIDYDIGTAIRRDATSHKTVEQQRFVRYIFVPLGEKVRTVNETSQEDGAFDVQAPDDTADDQVRYMIEVLEKAYDGRALVKDALPKLEQCTASAGGYGDTVTAMKTVRDNRSELLSALDAMPVDKIPEGSALLDDLYDAIEASYRANVEYVAWAESANATGCASLSKVGARAAAASDAPKERFASRWNRAVAPKFGVRTFDAWYI